MSKFFKTILLIVIPAAILVFLVPGFRDKISQNDIISHIVIPQTNEKQEEQQENADRQGFSESIVQQDPYLIPDFSGEDYAVLNHNIPGFTQYDMDHFFGDNASGLHLSELDKLGRCQSAWARLDQSMQPTTERGEIGMIRPTGWVQNRYEGLIDSKPPYLYNRSHLIAYGLSGIQADERNLITGTRHMNAETMLDFELKVMRYLDHSKNHVLYRVTPYFKDRELVARGVEMEAYSIEDNGQGICFHVFVYNYQPGIKIDYRTGKNEIQESE